MPTFALHLFQSMKHFKFTFLLIVLVICHFSCTNNNINKKYFIQTKFEKGVKYYFTSISQSNTTINANNKQVEMSNNSETGLIYELLNDSSGFRHLKITYDVFKAKVKKNEQIQELDISDSLNTNPTNQIISKLKGASLIVYIDNKGKVLELKGYKELIDSLLTTMQISSVNTRQIIVQKLSELFGEGLLKSNMEQGFDLFPDSAISIGFKWQKQTSQKSEINLSFNNNYHFEDVKDNIAYLESKGEINSEGNTLTIMNITGNLKGKQTGSYKVDINNGLVIEGKSKIIIEGNMQAMGKEIPITIENSTTTSSRKM